MISSRIGQIARLTTARIAARSTVVAFSSGSDSITYSGGQASEGQGGFYGSGGARAGTPEDKQDPREKLLALQHDVENIQNVMEELEELEAQLDTSDTLAPKNLEIKNNIKKLMTGHGFEESLNNLEVNGSPVWGLSTDERELIVLARQKRNEC